MAQGSASVFQFFQGISFDFFGQLLEGSGIGDACEFDDDLPHLIIGRTASRGVFDVDATDVIGKGLVDEGFEV